MLEGLRTRPPDGKLRAWVDDNYAHATLCEKDTGTKFREQALDHCNRALVVGVDYDERTCCAVGVPRADADGVLTFCLLESTHAIFFPHPPGFGFLGRASSSLF
jgi:hypothetical protein